MVPSSGAPAVTTIGDAVMLVSPEPVPLLDALLDLTAAADKEDLPQLRVGVASGWAVSRAGDWFGSPVNVASRVTSVARPGSVLAAESTRELIGDAEESLGEQPMNDSGCGSVLICG
jgi:adenylate cyclase